jgi:hypothetical protein
MPTAILCAPLLPRHNKVHHDKVVITIFPGGGGIRDFGFNAEAHMRLRATVVEALPFAFERPKLRQAASKRT